MLGFLDTLCGPKASELNVKDKEKYAFDPKKLLAQIASIVLRVWTQDKRRVDAGKEGFAISFATHPDYPEGAVGRWASVLRRHGLLDPRSLQEYGQFMEEVREGGREGGREGRRK